MTIRLPVVVALSLAATPLTTALAQEAPLRVAVVDVQRVLTDTEAGRQRMAGMESLQKELQDQGERLQREIVDLRTRITDLEGSQGDASEIARLREESERKTTELREFGERATRDLRQRQETVLREIEQIVMPVIEAIGQEGRYTLVFRKFESGFVYVAPEVDITDQVIARVDAGAGSAGDSP